MRPQKSEFKNDREYLDAVRRHYAQESLQKSIEEQKLKPEGSIKRSAPVDRTGYNSNMGQYEVYVKFNGVKGSTSLFLVQDSSWLKVGDIVEEYTNGYFIKGRYLS